MSLEFVEDKRKEWESISKGEHAIHIHICVTNRLVLGKYCYLDALVMHDSNIKL